MFFDWRRFHADNADAPAVVNPRRRLRICLLGFLAALLAVLGRAVQLEVTHGAGFRAEALRPVERESVLPAARGRILARDGTLLACDRTVHALAVEYRWLEEPSEEHWLRNAARSRLPKSDRKSAEKLAAAKAQVLAERDAAARRLAGLCGLSPEQWAARAGQIQARVQRIAAAANRRRQSTAAEPGDGWAARVRRLLLDDPPQPRIIVREERECHVMAEDMPAAAVAEINGHAERYPGAKIVDLRRRTYPEGTLAADVVGPAGVERQYESPLRGHDGTAVEQTDRTGRVVMAYHREEPVAGRDLVLTLDVALQRTAEELLQSALQRQALMPGTTEPAGGSIMVMDVRDGAILAAASAAKVSPTTLNRVYRFHVAGLMGPLPAADWAQRFGFGRPTGVDLPGEAAGALPAADKNSRDVLPATPWQVLRMMAAVANGGRLVTPHLAEDSRVRATHDDGSEPPLVRFTHPTSLRAIRDGLRRAVADPQGPAHGTVYIEAIAVAGTLGTAEAGQGRAPHAWFAGYVPADEPKLALVIVLEHAGQLTAAGPVAKRLVLRMDQLGLL